MGDNRNPFRLLTRRALIGGAVGVVASGVSPVVASGFSRTFGPPEGEPHVLDVAALAASPARIVPVDSTVDVRRVDVTRTWTGPLCRSSVTNRLNQPIRINGHAFTLIGVTPKNFTGTVLGSDPETFVPLVFNPQLTPKSILLYGSCAGSQTTMWRNFRICARRSCLWAKVKTTNSSPPRRQINWA